MISKKAFKRFINDYKLSIQPICTEEYIERVFELIPDAKPQFDLSLSEIGEDFATWMTAFEFSKNAMIEDIKNNNIYQEFIAFGGKEFEKRWELRNFPKGGIPNNTVFSRENHNKAYLSVDLRQANFQALRKVGVYTCKSWKELVSKYTDSAHILNSKQFREIIYGNLNISRIASVEKYLTNEFRLGLEERSIIPENYRLVRFMPDELIYEIGENKLGFFEEKIKALSEDLGIEVKTQQFLLKSYYIQAKGDDRKIEFFGKLDLRSGNETIHCLGRPYYMIGLSLWKGAEKDDCMYDHMFLNQEGYLCTINEEFEIKRGN